MPNIVWAEPGTDATEDTSLFTSVSGAVSSSAAQVESGLLSLLCDGSAGTAQANRSGLGATAGRRIQYRFYTNGLGGSLGPGTPTLFQFQTSAFSAPSVLSFTTGSAHKLQFTPFAATTVTGTTAVTNNAWHEIVIAYHVTNSTTFKFLIYLDGSLEMTCTAGTIGSLTAFDTWSFIGSSNLVGSKQVWFSGIIVDDGTDADGYTGCATRRCTAKRPNANGGTNSFDTTTSTTDSGYGTGNSIYVNERPTATTGARSQAGVGIANENFALEGLAVGDIDLTGKSITGYVSWAKGTGIAADTVWSNGVASVPTPVFSGASAAHFVATTTSTYPSSASCVGMGRPSGNATDAVLTECGMVVVYLGSGSTTGSGGIKFGGSASIEVTGSARITQMGRYVGTDESTPTARVTQMGRFVGTDESAPSARITQMARQVGYPYQCPATPTPPSDIPVRILASFLLPHWELERFDEKVRTEDTLAGMLRETFTAPPTWASDGVRWQLFRLDAKWTPMGRLIGPEGTVLAPGAGVAAWQLERFDLKPRTEERA